MTFAFSRDGAVPGHKLWRRLGKNRTPTWAVLFVCLFALIVTIPAYFPNHLGTPGGVPRGHLDLGDRALHRLHDPGVPALAHGRQSSSPGRGRSGAKYKWINPVAFVWVGLCVIIFCLPFSPEGVFFKHGFNWSAVNYAPIVTIGVMLAVTIWFAVVREKDVQGPGPHDRRARRRRRSAGIAQAP